MIEGPLSAFCPASALQLHQRTTILIDEAASKLSLKDYYKFVGEMQDDLAFVSTARQIGSKDKYKIQMSEEKIKVLVVGAGNMGRSHALAYASIPEFEIVAVCTRSQESRAKLMSELPEGTLGMNDYENALNELKPDAVCISTYPDTHYPFAKMALEAGCHVFTEKPLAENTEQCSELVDLAKLKQKALVVGYILRQHPSWIKFA